MNPMQRTIPVNPEQIKNAIKLIEAKIGMQQDKLAALTKHGDMTRRLVTYLSRYITHSPENITPPPVTLWIETHKLQEKADRAVVEIQIAELKSQLTINQFMLEEAEKQGSGLIAH